MNEIKNDVLDRPKSVRCGCMLHTDRGTERIRGCPIFSHERLRQENIKLRELLALTMEELGAGLEKIDAL